MRRAVEERAMQRGKAPASSETWPEAKGCLRRAVEKRATEGQGPGAIPALANGQGIAAHTIIRAEGPTDR